MGRVNYVLENKFGAFPNAKLAYFLFHLVREMKSARSKKYGINNE